MSDPWGLILCMNQRLNSEPYDVRASARRKKTMTAFRENGRIVVVVPASMSAAARACQIPSLVSSFLAKEQARKGPRGEQELTTRACELWNSYLRAELGEHPRFGVRWAANQTKRWGSNTVSTGEIRLSKRLQELPGWVTDAVLIHELVHFTEHNHTPRFWRLATLYPKTERARGFLEALVYIDGQTNNEDSDEALPETLW